MDILKVESMNMLQEHERLSNQRPEVEGMDILVVESMDML
jgi:hypothetical protein